MNFCRANKGKGGAVFAHEEYCDYYYECDPTNDEPVLQACPNGLAFAGKGRGLTTNCDYPHRVSCPDGTRVMGREYLPFAFLSRSQPWQKSERSLTISPRSDPPRPLAYRLGVDPK